MATNKNFEVKNGLSVGGTERISSAGAFSGSLASGVTATTQSAADSSTKIATTAYTDAAITAVIGGAPGTLDTLNELAAAINDDASYASTLTTALATKAPLASPTFTGTITVPGGTSGTRIIKDNYTSGSLANQGTIRSSGGNYWGYGTYQDGSANWKSAVSVALERSVFAIDEDTAYWSHAPSQTVAIGSDLTTQPTKKVVFDLENGKVGIGTTAPTHGLTVSDLNGGDDANMRRITIKSETHGANSGFRFDSESANGTARAGGYYFQPGDTDATTYLGLSSTDASYQMVITKEGNIGIGTTSPVASSNKTVLAVQGVWGGVVDIMVGTVVHASFGTDNFASGQSARIQSQDGIVFKSGGSTERMRIDSSGNTQIGAPQSSHIGGSKLFVNKAVNAAPATSGTTQTGGALRLRGGDNAVLDMGLNSVNTWIQATDRANLANGYTLSLNPNGGNVGIGTMTPNYQLDIENSSHAVARLYAGTSSSASLRLQNDAQHWDVNLQTNDKFAIYDHTAGTQPFTIMPTTNNVGIGVAAPTAKFHVADGSLMVAPYSNNSHAGAYHIIGSVANYSTANGRYIHAQLNTPVNLMFHIIMEGYTYTAGQRYGRCSGYVYNYAGGGNGATGSFGGPGVYDGRISGNIVAMHSNQNNPNIEIVIDTGSTGTGNRWGSYSLVGGSDHITSYAGVEVIQYTTSSTGTRQYTS